MAKKERHSKVQRLSRVDARGVLEEVLEILWPPDDPTKEWSPDTMEELVALFEQWDIVPNYVDGVDESEINEEKVREEFEGSAHHNSAEKYQVDFEHDQWWVTELGTGQQWSVAETSDGLDFEQVSDGDE